MSRLDCSSPAAPSPSTTTPPSAASGAITIGRKLWLFFRGQEKLEHLTVLMSVMYTARLQGVDERAYLTWVLERLATREWSAEAAAALLPEAWRAAQ